MTTVALIGTLAFLRSGEAVGEVGVLVLLALINSTSFAGATYCQIEALKHLPTSLTFPLVRLNTLIVVIFSIVYFRDALLAHQVAGMALAVGVIVFMARQGAEPTRAGASVRTGLMLVFVAMLSGAVAAISSKFAAQHTNHLAFIALSYGMGSLFSLTLVRRLGPKRGSGRNLEASLIGIAMGAINFVGFSCFLMALTMGPLSIIILITGMYFLVAIFLAALVYHERISPPRALGIALTVLSLVLLRS